jgi:5'-methylthioadenosine phosphorylase
MSARIWELSELRSPNSGEPAKHFCIIAGLAFHIRLFEERPLQQAEIGIIGGSGLYSIPGLTKIREKKVSTPFGAPSDAYVLGSLEGKRVAFLARHGRGHRLLPTELNFRANIYGMKELGVERIVSVSAVGSLKEEHRPGEFVIPNQFFDRTRHRISTFFGGGIVVHIAFADPVCGEVARVLKSACDQAKVPAKSGGTYLCMEGPQFSTKAESNVYRSWGMDIIGMTNLQEAKLAREAEICYATVAMVTDYDCWHPGHEAVTVEQVLAVLGQNASNACEVVRRAVASMPKARACKCGSALKHAIQTQPNAISAATRKKFALLLGKYLGPVKKTRA